MNGPTNGIQADSMIRGVQSPDLSSNLKTYGFALLIILGIGGLALCGTGYFHVGALSNLSQVQGLILTTVSGGIGAILLMIGIIGLRKSCQKEESVGQEESSSSARSASEVDKAKVIESVDTQNGLVYGADAWRIWGIEVADEVPPPPKIDWNEHDKCFQRPYRENYTLIYIPHTVRVFGKERHLNLEIFSLCTMGFYGGPNDVHVSDILEQFDQDEVSAGWRLMSKQVIPSSINQDIHDLKHYDTDDVNLISANKEFRIPSLMEAAVLVFMVYDFTHEQLLRTMESFCIEEVESFYREEVDNCIEEVDNWFPITIGSFSESQGLKLHAHSEDVLPSKFIGVLAVKQF